MTAEELDGITRRRLVIVAVSGYENSPPGFDEAIAAQVERITDWLAHPDLDEDRRFEVSRAPAMSSVQEVRNFLHGENLAAAEYDEAVVVYITGHGLRRNTQRHYLTLAKTEENRLLATAFPSSELISAVLDSESEHVLVLVDSCFSGTLHAELSSLIQDLSNDRHAFDGAAVVTAGNHYEQPLVGSFTERLALAYERMQDEAAGYTASHLSFHEWEQLLDEVGQDEDGSEKDLVSAEWIVPRKRKKRLSACLPNPRYQPAVSTAGPALRQLTLTTTAGTDSLSSPLDEFWLERASGRAAANDPGWYFSGRAEPMRALTEFLRAGEVEGESVLVVTGAAGSGKSALLARLVTLSDPGFTADPHYAAMVAGIPAELRPDVGAVDIAVLARNKSARAVVEDLLTALGTTGNNDGDGSGPSTTLPLQTLLMRVAARTEGAPGPVTVVIDALDEAQDPLALVNDVVLPLARLNGPDRDRPVRLLLGIRSSPLMGHQGGAELRDERADQLLLRLTDALGSEGILARILRSDGPHCADDIAAYAATLLLAPSDSPYYGAAEAAAEAARIIADAVAPSFLDARIAADQLRKAEGLQDLTEERWLERLADGTTGLLREDIKAVSLSTGVPTDLLVTALRATTFAPGAGLPWADVWPAVTVALAAAEYGPRYVSTDTADHAIRTLRNSRLTGYLATAEEDARTVYRPVHQRLTDLLIADHDWLLAPPSATASRWWRPATGPQALAAANAAITPALAGLVERSWPHPAHPYVRRYFLHHAAAGGLLSDAGVPLQLLSQETSGTLRARLGLPLPAGDSERRMLTAAALIEPYADETVDVASRSGSIVFQRGVQGESREAPPDGLPAVLTWGWWAARTNVLAPTQGNTKSLCVVPTLDGRTLIAVLSPDGDVEIRDAATGRLTAEIRSEADPVLSLRPIQAAGGRTFLVALTSGSATIHDPTSGQPIAHASFPLAEEAHVLKDGSAGWEVFVLTGQGAFLWRPTAHGSHEAGAARVFGAEAFPAVYRNPLQRATAVVRRADGLALVAVATTDGIRLWDPSSGLTAHPPFGGTNAHSPMVVPRQGEDDLLLIKNGVASASLRQVWNPFRGERVPHQRIDGRAATVLPGGSSLAYAESGRISVRNLDGTMLRSFAVDAASVNAISALEGPTGPRIVSAGLQGLRLWDVGRQGESDGAQSAETVYEPPLGGQLHWGAWPLCRSEDASSGRGAPGLVVGTRRGLNVHDVATGAPLRRVDTGPVVLVEPLPSPPSTSYVAVRGRTDWSIWDLLSGESVGRLQGARSANAPSCIARTPTGLPLFASLAKDGEIICTTWDPGSREAAISTVTYHHRVQQARALAALPPGSGGGTTVIAVAGSDGIGLVDLSSGNLVCMLHAEGQRLGAYTSQCVAFQLGERTLLAAATLSALHVWDTADGTLLAACTTRDTLPLSSLPLPDGRTLLASGNPSGVRIWDPLTGELRHTLLTGAPVHALAAGTGPTGTVLHIHGPAGLATLSLDERLL
ncbi:AAA family ATPase [Streptomyces sp. NPDC051211]|uniref:AAA family ATPase n=1 Tax=Streptomyces sp. NPDC051211 TaxID=3154643 RepID=UPI00344EB275